MTLIANNGGEAGREDRSSERIGLSLSLTRGRTGTAHDYIAANQISVPDFHSPLALYVGMRGGDEVVLRFGSVSI